MSRHSSRPIYALKMISTTYVLIAFQQTLLPSRHGKLLSQESDRRIVYLCCIPQVQVMAGKAFRLRGFFLVIIVLSNLGNRSSKFHVGSGLLAKIILLGENRQDESSATLHVRKQADRPVRRLRMSFHLTSRGPGAPLVKVPSWGSWLRICRIARSRTPSEPGSSAGRGRTKCSRQGTAMRVQGSVRAGPT